MFERNYILVLCLLVELAEIGESSTQSISHPIASKNFGNGRRIIASLKGKIFDEKIACDETLSSLSVPFVQMKKKSSGGVICNGLLIAAHLMLAPSTCVDKITNTSKFDVTYKQTNGSIGHHGISWACKQPASRLKGGRQKRVALITLDKPLEARELTCFAGTKLDQWHSSTSLAITRIDETLAQRKPLQTDYLEAAPVSCNGIGDVIDGSLSLCLKIRLQDKRLCNAQGSILLWRQKGSSGNESYRLGMLVSADKLDDNNCLAEKQEGIIIEMLDLTRLWLDGHLSVLIHHCSKSRER